MLPWPSGRKCISWLEIHVKKKKSLGWGIQVRIKLFQQTWLGGLPCQTIRETALAHMVFALYYWRRVLRAIKHLDIYQQATPSFLCSSLSSRAPSPLQSHWPSCNWGRRWRWWWFTASRPACSPDRRSNESFQVLPQCHSSLSLACGQRSTHSLPTICPKESPNPPGFRNNIKKVTSNDTE